MVKLSREALFLGFALGGMILMGVVLILASPIWPDQEIYRGGWLLIMLGVVISMLVMMVTVVERYKAKRQLKRPQRTMHKRLKKCEIPFRIRICAVQGGRSTLLKQNQ